MNWRAEFNYNLNLPLVRVLVFEYVAIHKKNEH